MNGFGSIFVSFPWAREEYSRGGGDVKVTNFRVRGTLALLIAIAKLQRIIVFDARAAAVTPPQHYCVAKQKMLRRAAAPRS